jgi:hypothetical protein
MIGLQYFSGAFADNDAGSHRVARRHARHDGSIGNTQVFVVAWRKRFLVLPDAANSGVVLKVLPHPWKMLHQRDSEAL